MRATNSPASKLNGVLVIVSEVARAGDVSVSVALVGPSQPRDLGPRRGKLFLAQLVVHRGIEASPDLGPPGMSEIIDDRPGQLCGLRKWNLLLFEDQLASP